MKQHILVSIIVPVYKIENYVAKCIESILGQTYTNIEIILVDDGTPDRSSLICDTYAGRDRRIHVIHKKNGGLSDARNAGIEYAHGSYLLFVDGDDYIAPDMCEKLLHAVLEQNADLGICNLQVVHEEEISSQSYMDCSRPIRTEVLSGRTILEEKIYGPDGWIWCMVCNRLYRKELFQQLRFSVGKHHEDEFICFDVYSQCSRVACIENVLYYYVQRNGSIMTLPFNVRRLDGCEALLQRADRLISQGYSSGCVYNTITRSTRLLCQVFQYRLYREESCRRRYNELVRQFRSLGLIRVLGCVSGIRQKAHIAAIFASPKLYWLLKRIRNRFHCLSE